MPKRKPVLEPSIDLSDDPLKELKVMVRSSVHTSIAQYVEFYQSVRSVNPDKARVVDEGLAKFFADDKAFQNYRINGSAKRAAPPASANQGTGS